MAEIRKIACPADRGAWALENFMAGYGCAQAVLLAFPDMTGWDQDFAARLASSFGGGMGRMREVCGAVSGALMVLGVAFGYDDPTDADAKNRHYALVREFADRFRARNPEKSIICRELLSRCGATTGGKAEARTEDFYQRRPCASLCVTAAEIADTMLRERGKLP